MLACDVVDATVLAVLGTDLANGEAFGREEVVVEEDDGAGFGTAVVGSALEGTANFFRAGSPLEESLLP